MIGSPSQKHSITSQLLQNGSAYCSHDCLMNNKKPDRLTIQTCPNQAFHDDQGFATKLFTQLLAAQLSSTDSNDSGLTLLGKSGRSGVLYKVHLRQTGHCLVAKSYKNEDLKWLQNELSVYDRLQDLQGIHIPVCCGAFHFQQPVKEAGGRFIQHLLLLSWAGEGLSSGNVDYGATQAMEAQVRPQLMSALRQIHEFQVVHGDTERRNFLFDQSAQRFILVDFERSRLYSGRSPCNPDEPCRKTYRDKKGRRKLCMYCREMWAAGEALSYESPGPSPGSSSKASTSAMPEYQAQDGSVLRRDCTQRLGARTRHRTSQARDTTGEVVKMHSMKLRTRP